MNSLIKMLTRAMAVLVMSASLSHAEFRAEQPNIIIVITDDQGYGDLSCHGHPFLKTANLDKLYDQSTRFGNYHVSPTCAPTRAALMAGKAPFKLGITHTILERERMVLGVKTVADILKEAGYTTGIFGKWHLGDEEPYQPQHRGFDEVFIHGGGGIGQDYPVTCADVPGNAYFDPVIRHNGIFKKTSGFCTDVFFQHALGWIRDSVDQDQPFFAYISTNAPHGPFIAPEQYKALYRDACGGNEEEAAFFGMIHNIDDNMGLLMEKLAEWDLEENTLLIFMTDNGTARGKRYFNAGMKGNKNSLNEGGSRVPLFMRWKGTTTAGMQIDRMTRHYDLFPTLAEIAGVEVPEDLDGRSLIPLLKYPRGSWLYPWQDRYTFFHRGRWDKKGIEGKWGDGNTDPDKEKWKNFAVRSERWRLVGKEELYDVEQDPGETTNVILEFPEIAEAMLKAYDKWWKSVRPMMVNEDAPIEAPKPYIVAFEKQKEHMGIPAWEAPEL